MSSGGRGHTIPSLLPSPPGRGVGGEGASGVRARPRHWRLAAFARDRAAVVALIVLVLVIGACAAAPLISSVGPYTANDALRYVPPLSHGYLLGTDQQGRDEVARLLWGGRVSLAVGVVPTLAAGAIGLALGMIAGILRGIVDTVIMRSLDVLFAFPIVLFAIALAGAMTPGIGTEVVAIMIILIPYFGRLARTATLSVMAMPYIEAARAAGGSPLAIALGYVFPNVLSPILVYATTLMGLMIVVGSGLSFLGLGVQPPTADWGAMVAEGRVVLADAPHVTVIPGVAILAVSLAFNFLGDGVRDALDPRTARQSFSAKRPTRHE